MSKFVKFSFLLTLLRYQCQEPPIDLNVASAYDIPSGRDYYQPYSASVDKTLGFPISMADDTIILSKIVEPKWAPIITGEMYEISSTTAPARSFFVDNTVGSSVPMEISTQSSANQWSGNIFNGTTYTTGANDSAMVATTPVNLILTNVYDNFTQTTIGSTLLRSVGASSPTTSTLLTTSSLDERALIF